MLLLLLSTELLLLVVCCLVDNSAAVSDIVSTSPDVPLVCAALVEKFSMSCFFSYLL